MPDMTLQEALMTEEVKGLLSSLIQDAFGTLQESWLEDLDLDAKIAAGIEAALPKLQESVQDTVHSDRHVRALHAEAVKLIEASKLKGAAKANLLEDYGLIESGEDVKPGRALALIEAEMDTDGTTVKKTAKDVLKDAIDEDVERQRKVLRESAPSIPHAPGGGGGGGGEGGETPVVPLLGDNSPIAQRLKDKGMDPAQFGATPTPAPAT